MAGPRENHPDGATAGPKRFRSGDQTVYSFMDDILVECPACGACAHVLRTNQKDMILFDPRRLVCPACGGVKEWADSFFSWPRPNAGVDAYFSQPLWLRTPCCGHTLWAFNAEHLDYVEQFVSAQLRESSKSEHGWRNHALSARLPKWIAIGKNRDNVLKGVARLRARLRDAASGA